MTRYDKLNVENFKNGNTAGYLCSMCGQYTTYNNSISNRGYDLICNQCVWKIANIFGVLEGDLECTLHKKHSNSERGKHENF